MSDPIDSGEQPNQDQPMAIFPSDKSCSTKTHKYYHAIDLDLLFCFLGSTFAFSRASQGHMTSEATPSSMSRMLVLVGKDQRMIEEPVSRDAISLAGSILSIIAMSSQDPLSQLTSEDLLVHSYLDHFRSTLRSRVQSTFEQLETALACLINTFSCWMHLS